MGLFIGSFVWGSIGDKIGRRKGLITTLSINAGFGLLSAVANSYLQLLVCRFLSGLGVGGSIPLIWAYASEITPTAKKGTYMSILATSWMIANVGTALLAYVVLPSATVFPAWRVFLALTTIPALTSSLFFIIAPESPMWLAANQEYDRLIATLETMYPGHQWKSIERCRVNNRQLADISRHRMMLTQKARGVVELYMKLFSHKYYRRTVLVSILNFALAFSSYGISLWMPTLFGMMEKHPDVAFCEAIRSEKETTGCNVSSDKNQYIDSMIFSLIQLPANLTTILLLDKIGPKLILLVSLLSSVATFLCLIYARSAFESFLICCVYSLLSVLSWNSLNVLNSFLFPISVRSTATGMMSASNRVGAWSGSLLIGLLLNTTGCGAPMLLIAVIILIGAIATTKLHVPRNF